MQLRQMNTSFKAVVGLLATVVVSAYTSAHATSVLGAKVIVASDGNVVATYLGHTADYSNDLYLDAPANGLGIIFNNHTTPVGTTMDLGYFTAGTELLFRIHVNNTEYDFFTGDGSLNPDQIPHAFVNDAYTPTETYVGFEDLFGGGDRDYDDVKFTFTNVAASTPDASSTLPLLGTSLIGLAALARRFRA